jgi:type III restriction enzyme
VLYHVLADMAAQRIMAAIVRATQDTDRVLAILDGYNREGSSRHVNFPTSQLRYETAPERCHVNFCVLDSDWEGELCRVLEKHPRVVAYVKNHGLGFEAPYSFMGVARRYRPDFILKIDDGHGPDDLLNLVAEVKGYRGEDAREKASTMETYWVPGVNNLGRFGRWAFAEFTNVWTMQSELEGAVQKWLGDILDRAPAPVEEAAL